MIELMIVMIIIGLLSAIALPNFIRQVGKARESEGKTIVGSVNKAQQAFHFERQAFADGTTLTDVNNELGVVVSPDFYSFTVSGASTGATVSAINSDAANDGTRNYAGGIAYATGAYTTVLCQSDTVGGTATASTAATCTAGTEIN